MYALLAAMVKSNDQLFSLYVGYDDGSFIEMDDIGGTGRDSAREAGGARTRCVPAGRDLDGRATPSNRDGYFCPTSSKRSGNYRGPLDYDPRERPWYKDAMRRDGSWLTGPYIFFATGRQGYTVQSP